MAATACTAELPDDALGLIAGGGELPVLVARGARALGLRVVCVAITPQVDPQLRPLCDRFRRASMLRVAGWARILRREGVERAIMVGGVDKASLMHHPLRLLQAVPDLTTIQLWYRRIRRDRRSPAILRALAQTLDEKGVALIDSTLPIQEHLARPGLMTRTAPTAAQRADIDFAWPIFQRTLQLGIGQAMAVREGDILAVEAAEGTDRMIARAGELCRRGGWTLLKGASPDHDRRADVPTVGVQTIHNLRAAGGRCCALAAGDVILVDRDRVLAEADRLGVAIVGVERTAAP